MEGEVGNKAGEKGEVGVVWVVMGIYSCNEGNGWEFVDGVMGENVAGNGVHGWQC